MILFVYGTLRKGLYNHDVLKDSQCLGNDSITAELYDLGYYPAVLEGEGVVFGELYEVEPIVMDFIDYMEFGAGYNRQQVRTHGGLVAHTYFYRGLLPKYAMIQSGDYRQYLENRDVRQ